MPEPVFLDTSHPKCQPCVVVASHVEWVQAHVQNPSSKSFLNSLASSLAVLVLRLLVRFFGLHGRAGLANVSDTKHITWGWNLPEIPKIEMLSCSYPPPPKSHLEDQGLGSTLCMYIYIYVLPL